MSPRHRGCIPNATRVRAAFMLHRSFRASGGARGWEIWVNAEPMQVKSESAGGGRADGSYQPDRQAYLLSGRCQP